RPESASNPDGRKNSEPRGTHGARHGRAWVSSPSRQSRSASGARHHADRRRRSTHTAQYHVTKIFSGNRQAARLSLAQPLSAEAGERWPGDSYRERDSREGSGARRAAPHDDVANHAYRGHED